MIVSATYKFRATHAVADDPELCTPHTREWSWTVRVRGPLVGPGWVMRGEALLDRMAETVPLDGMLNAWLGDENATVEKLLGAAMERLSLPDGIDAVWSELSESTEWSVLWP